MCFATEKKGWICFFFFFFLFKSTRPFVCSWGPVFLSDTSLLEVQAQRSAACGLPWRSPSKDPPHPKALPSRPNPPPKCPHVPGAAFPPCADRAHPSQFWPISMVTGVPGRAASGLATCYDSSSPAQGISAWPLGLLLKIAMK